MPSEEGERGEDAANPGSPRKNRLQAFLQLLEFRFIGSAMDHDGRRIAAHTMLSS
jgi:hypothetical protein